MPLDVGSYLADTMRLTTQQHGAYLLLLLDYWKTGPLPDDDAMLASITKVELKEWKSKVGPAVRRFFNLGGDGLLHQKRADAEIEKAGRISDARRNAAMVRHGGEARSPPNQEQSECKTDANAYANHDANRMQTGCEPAGIARGHAVAPPLPRTLTQAAAVTLSPREAKPAATAENGWIGWLDGKELVGGIEWDFAWPRIVEAARIDPAKWTGDEMPARRWLAEFRDVCPIEAAIRKVAERPDYSPPRTLAYFDKPVREACARSVA